MKGIVRMYGLYTPRIERKGKLTEWFMKHFRKDLFHRYIRQLARQRMEEREIYNKLFKRCYEKYYKPKNWEQICKEIMKENMEGIIDE